MSLSRLLRFDDAFRAGYIFAARFSLPIFDAIAALLRYFGAAQIFKTRLPLFWKARSWRPFDEFHMQYSRPRLGGIAHRRRAELSLRLSCRMAIFARSPASPLLLASGRSPFVGVGEITKTGAFESSREYLQTALSVKSLATRRFFRAAPLILYFTD